MKEIKAKDLKHIPGDLGLPFFGNFFPFIKDATQFYENRKEKHGDIFKFKTPWGLSVVLCQTTSNKFILVENGKSTSNQEAWELSIGELFPNGLMLMDGERHKYHRGIMQDAFKKEPIQGYVDIMLKIIVDEIAELEGKEHILAFPFFKNLTLKIATHVFFGIDTKENLHDINQAITNIVNAATALPIKLPFTTYQKGLNGRTFLVNFFKELLPERRKKPGKDLFSKFCLAKSEEGDQFTDQEIIDHLIFVLMAAHDTTAITLTFMSYFLAKNPNWQEKVRTESQQINLQEAIQVSELRQLKKAALVMKETLRIHPPLILVSRKLEKDLMVEGCLLPKNTFVNLVFQLSHHDERQWTNPSAFDPERFNKQRNEQSKCPFGYAPFGAGQHHCIGFNFAEIMVKLVMTELLQQFKISVPDGYECPIRDVPLKQPKDNLPLYIKKNLNNLIR